MRLQLMQVNYLSSTSAYMVEHDLLHNGDTVLYIGYIG